ncbi:hypothetical protein Ciccas_002512 [Cichlidogyrus casuarinus]|uniref:Uncharacterized protein n=1 Tax=Cichlidogyrus casuarinus TaxID=1844966 RepID=A0ABD2QH19_9PLAT
MFQSGNPIPAEELDPESEVDDIKEVKNQLLAEMQIDLNARKKVFEHGPAPKPQSNGLFRSRIPSNTSSKANGISKPRSLPTKVLAKTPNVQKSVVCAANGPKSE